MLLVSFITPTKFLKVKKVFISTLLDLSSPLTCMMVSNIWCFLIRYRTSQLCLAHLNLSRTSSPPPPTHQHPDGQADPVPQPLQPFELAKPNRSQAKTETALSSERLPVDRPGGSVEDIIPDFNLWDFFSPMRAFQPQIYDLKWMGPKFWILEVKIPRES